MTAVRETAAALCGKMLSGIKGTESKAGVMYHHDNKKMHTRTMRMACLLLCSQALRSCLSELNNNNNYNKAVNINSNNNNSQHFLSSCYVPVPLEHHVTLSTSLRGRLFLSP